MPRHPPLIGREILDQAAHWLVELRDPDASPQAREAFADWLRASPQHVRAYLDTAKLWGDVAHVSHAGDEELQAMLTAPSAAANVVQLSDAVAAKSPPPRKPPERSSPRMVASLVLALVTASLLIWWSRDSDPHYVTQAGELRVIRLADGSVMKLNSRADVVVRLSAEVRLVELREGQAMFEVAKNPDWPFVVRSGRTSVRAVGTQFDVNRRRAGTIVTVVEGRVAVSTAPEAKDALFPWDDNGAQPQTHSLQLDTATAAAPTLLAAGQRVVVGEGGAPSVPAAADVAAATGWLQHEIVFNNEPLESVVEELNRYVDTPIVLAEPSLAGLRVNAVLQTTSAESLLRFVSRLEGVRIERDETEVRISKEKVRP